MHACAFVTQLNGSTENQSPDSIRKTPFGIKLRIQCVSFCLLNIIPYLPLKDYQIPGIIGP
jgi:hypothetical protein